VLEFPATDAEAAAPAAGFFYQLRYALFRALKRSLRDPTGAVGVERVDDIAASSGGVLAEVDQLKHTTNPDTVFTDLSSAVWRTLGNWIRLIQLSRELNLATLELFFVTNANLHADSGIALLGPVEDARDVASALTKLGEAALTSENEATAGDRALFLALDEPVRVALIKSVRFIQSAPNLEALKTEIEDILHYACESEKLSEFTTELEGWWFEKVATAFSGGIGLVIPLLELDAKISYLREKYKVSFLHIDVETPTDNPNSLDAYLFARQVLAVKVGEQRLRNAQRDFLKASAQRSKWLRDARIDPAELTKYDEALEERWNTQSTIMWDELSQACNEDDQCKSGRQVLGWAETQEVPLKGASAQFLTSGSYHALADSLKVGWHPNFRKMFGAK
jgi:hypothetical protein